MFKTDIKEKTVLYLLQTCLFWSQNFLTSPLKRAYNQSLLATHEHLYEYMKASAALSTCILNSKIVSLVTIFVSCIIINDLIDF